MTWRNRFSSLELSTQDTLPELSISLLDHLSVIDMTGDDKKSYLQGQVTCDVVSLEQNQSTLGAHCDAKGKTWAVFRLFHHHDGYAMVQTKSGLETELRELKKYAVFSKVVIEESQDILLGVAGVKAQDWIQTLSSDDGDVRTIEGGTAVKIEDNRWLLYVSSKQAETLIESVEATFTDHQLWEMYDIESAIPSLPNSAQNEHIPQALNLQALNGISFNKGCYTGQETVARAKYRGTNKRAMYIVHGATSLNLAERDSITLERSVGENWRATGELLNCYQYSDGKAIGLIVLPNNLDEDTKLRLVDDENSEWGIEPLPYSLEDE